MGDAKRDNNMVVTLIGVSSVDGITPVTIYVDPVTHRVLTQLASGGSLSTLSDVTITSVAQGDVFYYNGSKWVNLPAGTSGLFLKTQGAGANPIWAAAVTAVSVASANGITGSSSGGATPALTITLGAITPTSVNGLVITTTTGTITLTNGKTFSCTNTITLSGTDGKTLTVSNNLTLAGTDGTTITFQGTDTYVGRATTDVLTNKQISPRLQSVTDAGGTLTPSADANDMVIATALSQATTIAAPTPTANLVQGQKMIMRLKDNGTARALTWNGIYRASSDLALPSTTIISKTIYLAFIYNSTDTKWDLVALLNNF